MVNPCDSCEKKANAAETGATVNLSKKFYPVQFLRLGGWSGGAMVLGKLPVPGRRCGLGVVWTFLLSSILSLSLWETARYRLKYCLKGPLGPKQPASQPASLTLGLLPL